MNLSRFSPKLIFGILLTIFFGVSLYLRVALPYDQVFSGDWIKFTSIDAYYHMRLVDNLAHNFPSLTSFDPYFIFPGGNPGTGVYFFNWLMAGIIWIIGLGSPTQHTVDVIGVYFPAVLGALAVIPVYFIGKALFNRWAGVVAAALIAVLPGEYIGRSILGFTDQHVAETLFSATAVLFLILAIKEAGQRQLTYSHIIRRDWQVITRTIIYSVLAGIFLGIYLITWGGAILLAFITSVYFIIQFIINHLRHKSSDHLGIIGFIFFLIAAIVFLPFSPTKVLPLALIIALFIPPILSGVSWLVSHLKLKTVCYPLTLVGIGIIFIAIFYAVAPQWLSVMLEKFRIFAPVGATATTTLEMQHFLSPQGSFSTAIAWGNYTTSFFLTPDWPIPGFALISFVILIFLFIKQRSDDENRPLFIIWTLIILIATLVQRRFAYYLVVNIALLSAYLSWQCIWLAGLRKLQTKPAPVTETAPKKGDKAKVKKSRGISIYHINVALVIIIVFFFVIFPNIVKAREVASQARFAPSDAWMASLIWMRENTPEPFGDPDAYYGMYEAPAPGEDFKYPESAYGVTSWWDYGYWISRIAHRIPSANPSQAPEPITKVANLFLSHEESLTHEKMKELGSSYIIADYSIITSKFWAVVTWSGRELDEFIGVYHLPYEGELVPIQLFHPEYYRTTIVRLFNFNGESVPEVNPMVISYDEKIDAQGNRYRQINNFQDFPSYQEALDYINSQESGNHKIVGVNPFTTPIPLEEMRDFRLVYSSESGISIEGQGVIPEVKIFEYVRDE